MKTFEAFDNMNTEELEEILRQDICVTTEEELDQETLLYILSVLVAREKEQPTVKYTDITDAWTSFYQNFLPIANKVAYSHESFHNS